jgi:DNA-directed RNA polymerase specialized sigma24 family protein
MPANVPAAGDWLAALAQESLGDFELTTEIDTDLSIRAVAARHDSVARDQLFALLAFKLRRFCTRFHRWNLDPWEFEDVLQESYLVFVDLLASWRPLEGAPEPAGFGYYVFRVFPLRLTDHVNALVRTRRDRLTPISWAPEIDLRLDPTSPESDASTAAIMAAVCGRLNAVDATIFRLRSTTEQRPETIARIAGVSRRTLYRRWGEIVRIAREELEAS